MALRVQLIAVVVVVGVALRLGMNSPTAPSGWSGKNDWFVNLFGFMEQGGYSVAQGGYSGTAATFDANKAHFDYDTATGLLAAYKDIERTKLHATYQAGHFTTPSLAELRDLSQDVVLPGALTVESLEDTEVSSVHTKHKYATFQAASQFNCLEFPDFRNSSPEQGITKYVSDKTQGPACSIACGAGTVVRNYFAQLEDETVQASAKPSGQRTDWGSSKNQINTVKEMHQAVVDYGSSDGEKKYFDVRNGYSFAPSAQHLDKLNAKLADIKKAGDDEKIKEKLRVGVQSDTMVTGTNWGKTQQKDMDFLVTQVYGSAIAKGYQEGGYDDKWEPFARMVLRASYEATMHVALLNAAKHPEEAGARVVYLTALGGGVFGNKMEWIAEAMDEAFKKFKDYDLQVKIVSYHKAEAPLRKYLADDWQQFQTGKTTGQQAQE